MLIKELNKWKMGEFCFKKLELKCLKAAGNGPSDLFTVVNGYLIGIYFNEVWGPSDHLSTEGMFSPRGST